MHSPLYHEHAMSTSMQQSIANNNNAHAHAVCKLKMLFSLCSQFTSTSTCSTYHTLGMQVSLISTSLRDSGNIPLNLRASFWIPLSPSLQSSEVAAHWYCCIHSGYNQWHTSHQSHAHTSPLANWWHKMMELNTLQAISTTRYTHTAMLRSLHQVVELDTEKHLRSSFCCHRLILQNTSSLSMKKDTQMGASCSSTGFYAFHGLL